MALRAFHPLIRETRGLSAYVAARVHALLGFQHQMGALIEVDPVRGGGAVRLAAVHAAFEGVGVEGVFRHGREVFSRPSRSQKSSRKCWPDPRSWPPDFDQSAMNLSICSAVGSRMPGEWLDRGGVSRRGWFSTGHQQGGRPETAQSLTCLNLRISGKQSP